MPPFLPPTVAVPTTSPDDPRVGHLLGRALDGGSAPRVVIAGFPTDVGVRRNGGRPGAAEGPAAIRAALYKLTPDAERAGAFTELVAHTRDLGDLEVTDDLDGDQRRLGEALAPHVAAGSFVILLGGGHETAYGHFLAQAAALEEPVRILNWDAHTDVRELRDGKAHSGSPFRQALDDALGRCGRYAVAGLQPHSVARAHLELVEARGATVFRDDVTPERVRAIYAGESPTLVSFDIDAVDRSRAPGVSAPTTNGLTVPLWLSAAYLAGRTRTVRSADIVELSPPHDRDGQTAALAALTVWWILKGIAERG
ncbi:MAG TPA: formimidoylglutamase [Gemmatimonadales bacterium]